MNFEFQRQQIGNSLRVLTEIFKSCAANYRIFGSILIVAHTGEVFRRIGDIGVIFDARNEHYVFEKLKKDGFVFEKKGGAGYYWFEANKDGCLGITFFLVGEFNKNYFSRRFMKIFELRVRSDYLQPTEYRFEQSTFVGIPLASAIAGIKQSFSNPKRKLDLQILEKDVPKNQVKIYNNISFYVAGIKLPYLFDALSFLYNIYGSIRVMFGYKYALWD